MFSHLADLCLYTKSETCTQAPDLTLTLTGPL